MNKIIDSKIIDGKLKEVAFKSGKLKAKAVYENEPSEEALTNFNKQYNKHFDEFNKWKDVVTIIKIIHGDLLEAEEDIIVHQVNCQGVMGSGVALQIKNKYPNVYNDYIRYTKNRKGDKSLLGQVLISMHKTEKECKYIAHLFGQLNYGYGGKRYTSYDALYDGLVFIKIKAKEHNKSVALPYKIGSDRGGADWDIVHKMIEKVFEDYEVSIYKLT